MRRAGITGFTNFQSSSHQNSFGSVKLNFESPDDYSVSGNWTITFEFENASFLVLNRTNSCADLLGPLVAFLCTDLRPEHRANKPHNPFRNSLEKM